MSHEVVSREEWLKRRRELLRDEKALTRFKDVIAEKRRNLPRVLLEKDYTFENEAGEPERISDLFGENSQLIVYHFMYPEHWALACPGCTELADCFNGITEYLDYRDASFVAVSRGSIERLKDYKERHGWRFKWVSSLASDFNFDFNVSFKDPKGPKMLNFRMSTREMEEAHGVSVFIKGHDDQIFHTYSCHARGVDILFCSLQYMDLLPLGRQDEKYYNSSAIFRRVPP